MRISNSAYYLLIFLLAFMSSFSGYAAEKMEKAPKVKKVRVASTNTVIHRMTGGAGFISTQEVEYVYCADKENFDRLQLLEKPAIFDSWTARLDYIHNNLSCEVQAYVDKADVMFADGSMAKKAIPESRFRLGIYTELEKDGGIKFRLAPDVDADIKIPNIEERLRLFIDTMNSDDLPGTTVMERERGFNAGLRKVSRWFRYDVGVKVRFPPVLFGRIDWRPQWQVNEWKVNPLGRVYWESDDGYGALSSLSAYRYIGSRVLIRSVTAVKWTEKANSEDPPPEDLTPEEEEYYYADAGMEWEHSFMVGYVSKMLSSKDVGKNVGISKVARATGLMVSVFGNTERTGGPERVRFSLGHRRPIYKDWMFLMIIPELEWYKEKDWAFIPRIRVGIDMLFSVGDVQRNR